MRPITCTILFILLAIAIVHGLHASSRNTETQSYREYDNETQWQGKDCRCKITVLSAKQQFQGTPRSCELATISKEGMQDCVRSSQRLLNTEECKDIINETCHIATLNKHFDKGTYCVLISHKYLSAEDCRRITNSTCPAFRLLEKTELDACCKSLALMMIENRNNCGLGGVLECYNSHAQPICRCPVGRKGRNCNETNTEEVSCTCDNRRIFEQDNYVLCNSTNKTSGDSRCYAEVEGRHCICDNNKPVDGLLSCSEVEEAPDRLGSSASFASVSLTLILKFVIVRYVIA